MNSDAFQFDNDLPWESAGPGVERKLLGYGDSIMMVKVKFEKGAVGEIHQHSHTQVSYVESGSFEMTINGVQKTLRQGDGFYVQPNVLHGTTCIEPGVLVDVFSPIRKDFLQSNS